MTEHTSDPRKIHPLFAAAAVAVILACAVAMASMLGWLPRAGADARSVAPQVADQGAEAAQLKTAPAPKAAAPARPPAPAKVAAATPARTAPAASASCTGCGVVEHVREIRVPTGRSAGGDEHNLIGTLAGGVAGGVVGNQFGGGSGRDALTVLGAVGGALAGREVQKNMKGQEMVTRYETQVRLDDGSVRTFTSDRVQFASGDHVRVVDNRLQAR